METTDRPKMLLELLGEIDHMDAEAFPPNAPIAPHEKIIGTADDYERRVFASCNMHRRENGLIAVETAFARRTNDPENAANLERHGDVANWLHGMCWMLIQERLGLYGNGKHHGMREGWQIVSFDPHSGTQQNPIFKLFGIQ